MKYQGFSGNGGRGLAILDMMECHSDPVRVHISDKKSIIKNLNYVIKYTRNNEIFKSFRKQALKGKALSEKQTNIIYKRMDQLRSN